MPMIKDIKELTKDIEKFVIEGKAKAASNIQFSLQYRSPYWTGTFNASWKIQKGTPVDAIKPRKENQGYRSGIRAPEKGPIIKTSLSEALYIGNETEYAGFVINRMRTLNPDDTVQFYEDLFSMSPKADTSPIPNDPEWYYYYIGTEEIEFDIDNAFTSLGLGYAGFSAENNY